MRDIPLGATTAAHPSDVTEVLAPAEGFPELFAAHFRAMTHLAAFLGADDPEDVAQEAFARLHQRTGRLRDPNAALAYLRSTVCNLSRSRLRRMHTARSKQAFLVRPPGDTVEQFAVSAERSRELMAAVRALPRRPREVLVLRYWLDMSEAQIAETLGVSTGAVKSYASRGLAAIEQTLEGLA